MVAKVGQRSPNYPKVSLPEAVDRARRIYRHAHRGRVDRMTALELMGYRSDSGPAGSTLSALRKFGLLDGRSQELRLSDLALKILEPMDEAEKMEGLRAAALSPEIYREVLDFYSGRLPSDEVLRAYLIRTKRFSSIGAKEFIRGLRGTQEMVSFDERGVDEPSRVQNETRSEIGHVRQPEAVSSTAVVSGGGLARAANEEKISCRVAPTTVAEVLFIGPVTQAAVNKLIAFLELSRDNFPTEPTPTDAVPTEPKGGSAQTVKTT